MECPFKNFKQIAPGTIEKCLEDLPLVSMECFWCESNFKFLKVVSKRLAVGSAFNCLPNMWFDGDLVHILLKVLLRNNASSKKILIMPHTHIQELVKLSKKTGKEEVKRAFETVYKNLTGRDKNVKIFSYDVWLFLENVGADHWTCRFLFLF